jgi:hypothetical protein
MQGSQYDFLPTASDPDGNSLTFGIANAPAWATFDPVSGRLSGKPSASDLGTTSQIRISVSDGQAVTTLPDFSITVVGTASGTTTLRWDAPTTSADGSPLTDLAGYKVYWGTTQGSYANSAILNNPGLTTYVIDQLTPATWYFVVSAFDTSGNESEYSAPVSKTVL